MQLSLASACTLASCLTFLFPSALAKEAGGAVQALDQSSFKDFLDASNVTLVEFFAPWCGHCKKLAPEYEKAAEKLKTEGIRLAQVDCDSATELCQEHGIRGYPTLQIFKNGEKTEYEGPRDAEGIVKYMKRQVMPAVQQLTPEQLGGAFKDEEVMLVYVPGGNKKLNEAYAKAAESLRMDYSFTSLKEGVYMMKKVGETLARFDDTKDFDPEKLAQWVQRESLPLVDEVGPENYAKYMAAGLPMAYLFYEKESMLKENKPIIEEAARPHKGKINVVSIDAEKFEKHAEALALPKKWPGLVIHDMEGELKYPFSGKLNDKAAVTRFFKDFVDGKLEPTYRSEDIPAKEEPAGEVKTVVYKNFDQIVMDSKKDVLLELYAPWCGACKRIAPTYEKVAKAYAEHANKVVIAKMDGTANDLPKSVDIKLTKFPTILLFKAGDKDKPIEFEQLTDKVQVFADFIAKNGANKVEVKVAEEPSSNEKEEASSKDKEEL